MKGKGYIRLVAILTVLIMVISFGNGVSAEDAEKPTLTATEADEWTALFDRRGQETRTWLGADGIYSVSLDGNDAMGSATSETASFFIFSDTLMGSSDENGQRVIKANMPAQSSALLTGNQPDADALRFVYGNKGTMLVGTHLFGEHKWMLDCLVLNDTLYILGFPEEGWKPKQIDMISIPLEDATPQYKHFTETEKITELWHRIGDKYLYAYGIGITANTEQAGAPDPDGYIYVYGYRDAMQEFSRKDLIVSRIKEEDFPDFSKLTYWNGESWGKKIEDSAVLLTDVSCEMSVTPVTVGPYRGKYIAVYTQYTQSSNIMYAIGDTPYGPFDTPVKFYHAPEHGEVGASGKGTRYVYNAKAHPHLSTATKLLVSYNVNVMGDGAEQWTTDYHPRFVWLDLDPYGSYVEDTTAEDTTLLAPDTTANPDSTDAPMTDAPMTDTPITTDTPATTDVPSSGGGKGKSAVVPVTVASVSLLAVSAVICVLILKKRKK